MKDDTTLLDHPNRRALIELVRREPGVHLEAAKQALGVGAGTLVHHVRVLTKRHHLRVVRTGAYARLYPIQMPHAAGLRDALLRHPRARALYDLVTHRPGIGLRGAARSLRLPVSSLQWHVDKLLAAGVVERRGRGLFVAGA